MDFLGRPGTFWEIVNLIIFFTKVHGGVLSTIFWEFLEGLNQNNFADFYNLILGGIPPEEFLGEIQPKIFGDFYNMILGGSPSEDFWDFYSIV